MAVSSPTKQVDTAGTGSYCLPNQPSKVLSKSQQYLRTLAWSASAEPGGNREAAESAARAAEELNQSAVREELVDRLSRAFARADLGQKPADAGLQQTRSLVLRQADAALAKLAREEDKATLTTEDRVGLEAVIRLSGRPSILIKDGDLELDPADPDLAPWSVTVRLGRDGMKRTIRSVGRIDRDGFQIGTGFVVAPGLVMTNLHVLQAVAHRARGSGRWIMLGGHSTIDFAVEFGSTRTSQFDITGVAFAGPDPIGGAMDVGKLDLALLTVAPTGDTGEPLPAPLALAKSAAPGQRMSEVYMVGYPARPTALPTGTSPEELQLVDTLKRVFRMRYGYKRLALGSITHPLGQVPHDPIPWAIGHDATTLGGNSGSCVVALEEEEAVLGIHFGGVFFDHNLAHVFAAIPALTAPAGRLDLVWH